MNTKSASFDLVIVGTGVAASSIAARCTARNWRVAIVDERSYGGTCQLRGCDPKKVLRRGAEVIDAARRMQGKGVAGGDKLRVDWPALMAFKHSFTDGVSEAKEESFGEQGIECFHGRASFTDERTLAVGDRALRADHIVLANGAHPMPVPVQGAEHLLHSDQFMELETLPPRLVFAGGGYIAFEFAHLAVRAGADVTIVEKSDRPLGPFDDDLVASLVECSRSAGITIHTQAEVRRIEKSGDGFRVDADVAGRGRTFAADGVVHGLGRVPATGGLACERGNVAYGKQGIEVNEYLQSVSNPAVYAAGDVAATPAPPLTPVAALEAGIVADNLLDGNHATADYDGIPSCVFTIPPLATVGLTEAQANDQGLQFECRRSDMSDWYFVRRVGATAAMAKILVGKQDQRILGAHLLGPECDELINFFALAIRRQWQARDLKDLVNAYPTAASNLGSLL